MNKNAEILIVDDKPDNLHLLTRILSKEKYIIRQLRDGNMVMASLLSAPADIILLDIMMPETDGYEVCRRLKDNRQTCDIPVIFISALKNAADKVKAFSVGGVDYISKPFQEEEVLARVRTHLTLRRLQIGLQKKNTLLHQEIEGHRRTAMELRKLHSAVQQSASSVVITDTEGTIEFVNPAFCRKTGFSREEALGNNPRILKSGKNPPDLYSDLWETITRGDVWRGPLTNKRKNGEIFWEYATIAPVRNPDGQISHYVAVKIDISELKRTEAALVQANEELRRLNNLDGLTRIANRRRFDEYLGREWNRQVRDQGTLALLMCDIDFFKRYNDTYGHLKGDETLCRIAKALEQTARRPADLSARYGGEEFVMVLPNTDADGAKKVAEDLLEKVGNLKIDHSSSSVSPYVTLSIGVTAAIPSVLSSVEDFIGTADRALYEAKEQGRNTLVFKNFRPE